MIDYSVYNNYANKLEAYSALIKECTRRIDNFKSQLEIEYQRPFIKRFLIYTESSYYKDINRYYGLLGQIVQRMNRETKL